MYSATARLGYGVASKGRSARSAAPLGQREARGRARGLRGGLDGEPGPLELAGDLLSCGHSPLVAVVDHQPQYKWGSSGGFPLAVDAQLVSGGEHQTNGRRRIGSGGKGEPDPGAGFVVVVVVDA